MAIIHVDIGGDDVTGNGTQGNPYASAGKAHSVASPGDTIYYHAGTYDFTAEVTLSVDGTIVNPITHSPYVSGAFVDTVIFDATGFVGAATDSVIKITGDYVIFDGIQRQYFTIQNNPVGRGISFSSSQGGAVKNITVHDTEERGLGGGAHGYLIQNVELYRYGMGHVSGSPAAWPGGIAPTSLGTGVLASNITVTGCYVHDGWGEGIIVLRSTGMVVVGNIIHDTYSVNIYIDKALAAKVDSNYIFDCNPGYFKSGEFARGINSASEGTSLRTANTEIRIRNNIIVHTSTGYRWFRDAANTFNTNYYSDVQFDNNLIYNTVTYAVDLDLIQSPAPAATGCFMRNNIFYQGSDTNTIRIGNTGSWSWQNNIFADFTPPRLATGVSSFQNQAPSLLNPAVSGAVEGFQLQFYSIANGAGVNISANTLDYFGKTRRNPPTIGPYEIPPAPTGTNDAFTVSKNTTLRQASSPSGVFVNDYLGMSGTLNGYNAVSTQGGAVYISGSGAFEYTPPAGFFGTDTFKYTISGMGGTGTATVTVTVQNLIPIAVADSYSANQDTVLNTNAAAGVLANDTLNSGTIIGYATATSRGGVIYISGSGAFKYTPPAGLFSPPDDTTQYTLQNNAGTGTATVSFTITSSTPAGSASGTSSGLGAFYRFRTYWRFRRIG